MDVIGLIMKVILLLMSIVSVLILSARLYINNLKGDERVIFTLGLVSQIFYSVFIFLQILSILNVVAVRDLIHAMGPEVDILLIGYLVLITFYYAPKTIKEYLAEIKRAGIQRRGN